MPEQLQGVFKISILESDAQSCPITFARFSNPRHEARIILQTVVDPVSLESKANQAGMLLANVFDCPWGLDDFVTQLT